jgi:hypothetical protein
MKGIKLLFVLLALAAAALACKVNFTSAKIDDAWTAHNEAGDQRTTTFEQNENFYVKVVLANAPDDTRVKTTFSTLDVEGDEDNKSIGENEQTSGSGTLTFTASNTKLWPAGKYKAEIYLNDKLDRTLNFEVKASQTAQATVPAPTSPPPPPPPTSPPQATLAPTQGTGSSTASITQAFMALDENGTKPATHFKPTDVVYTVFTLEAAQGAKMKAVWIAKDTQDHALNTTIEELPFEMSNSGQNWVSYTPDASNPLSPGRYEVDLYVNDTLSQAVGFTVEDVSVAPGAASITNGFMAFDQDGNSPTTVFGTQDVFYSIIDYSAPNGATIRAEWYADNTQDAQNSFFDSYEVTVSGTGSTWFSLTPNGTWSVGTYRVDYFIDNTYATSVYFEVQ